GTDQRGEGLGRAAVSLQRRAHGERKDGQRSQHAEKKAAFHLPRILRRRCSRTKQKGTASLRCPPAPLVWLPQHSRRPAVIRPATCPSISQLAYPAAFYEISPDIA